jgi:peptide/nickel transport system ATP-binding protein
MSSQPVLKVEGLTKIFRTPGRRAGSVVAASDVSFSLDAGEVLALVGESGSGKTTIGRLVTGLEVPTAGTVKLRPGSKLDPQQRVQMVFQDPYAAINPFNHIGYTVSRPLINYGHLSPAAAMQAAAEILRTVQLTPPREYLEKRPHQLSGGQRQRVVIARALAANPEVMVADEPVSMLDVSIRADVLRLLRTLLDEERVLSMIYITHDLLSARLLANRMMVLYRGHVVELGATETILAEPRHPYSQLLWSAIPNPRRAARGERVEVPLANNAVGTDGCPFAPRCPLMQERCQVERPPLVTMADGREVACHVVAPADASKPA